MGAPGAVLINGQRVDPKVQHVIAPGASIELHTPGGGGYGAASERDPALMKADSADGYVTEVSEVHHG